MIEEERSSSTSEELKDEDDAVELNDVIVVESSLSPTPSTANLKEKNQEEYHPDSVYSSIDGLRAIAVFLMVVRTPIARFMYGANPLSKAFGGDWLPPIFLYASGARLVAEQDCLKSSLAALEDKPAARKRLLAESVVKYYASTIVMFIIAYLFTIASFGPSRACAWDVLVPLGIANMIMYPINYYLNRFQWILLIPAVLLHIFYPVFFNLMDGMKYFDRGAFIPNWTAAGVLGNLFITGYCPLLGLLPFELTGMVMSHYILLDKKATPQRKGVLCFIWMLVLMIGCELKYFGEQLNIEDSPVLRKYIFCDWTALPISLSMALWLSGCFGIQFCTLSLLLDPLGPEVAGPASPRPRDTYVVREFFRRASLSAVSLYIFHAIIVNVIVRSTSYVETSSVDTYMFFTPIWTDAEWVGDIVFSIIGFVYFVVWEVILHYWFKLGKGIGTTEWIMTQGANLTWSLCNCACSRCCCPTDKEKSEDD